MQLWIGRCEPGVIGQLLEGVRQVSRSKVLDGGAQPAAGSGCAVRPVRRLLDLTGDRAGRALDAAERGIERLYTGDHDRALPDLSRPAGGSVRTATCGGRTTAPLRVHELAALVRHPSIVATGAAALSAAAGIRLWHGQLLYKPVDRSGSSARSAGTPTAITGGLASGQHDHRLGRVPRRGRNQRSRLSPARYSSLGHRRP